MTSLFSQPTTMDWLNGTTTQLAAKILGLANLLVNEIDVAEDKWTQDMMEAGFGSGPLTRCVEDHFEDKRREARDTIYSVEMNYWDIEPDSDGLIAVEFFEQVVVPEINDLDTGIMELRKAFLKTKHEHTPEWAILKFQNQQQFLSESLVHIFTDPGEYGKVYTETFKRAYHRQKIAELLPRLINACVASWGVAVQPRNEKYARELAALANNDWGYGDTRISLLIRDVDNALFNTLLTDVARDQKAATYERLYVCVGSMAMAKYGYGVVAIGYLRAIIHLLIWEDLDLEQAIFVVRGLKLLGLIEHDDMHKDKLKQDIQSAIPSVAKRVDVPGFSFRDELLNAWTKDDDKAWITESLGRFQRHT